MTELVGEYHLCPAPALLAAEFHLHTQTFLPGISLKSLLFPFCSLERFFYKWKALQSNKDNTTRAKNVTEMAKISNPPVMGRKQWERLRKVFTGHRGAIWWRQHKAPLLRGLLLGSSPQAYLSAVWKPRELISAQRVGGMLQQQREKFFLCGEIGWPACSCLKMLGWEVVGFKFGLPGGGVHLSGLLSSA